RHERGRYASIVVVAEGAEPMPGTIPGREKVYDQFGHVRLGGLCDPIAEAIEAGTGFESRVVLLGHVQRGGTPTAFDRVLSTRYGIAAMELVHEGAWGMMAALRGTEVVAAPMSIAAGQSRALDMGLYAVAETFFG